ncbi:MAG: hypothetical protein IJP66_02715 [Kiritimatiellae bacterium]|nr:hypothetical protein [Kiritimatiellia bacterium]
MNLNSRIAIAAAGAATLCLAAQATPRAAEASGADYLVSAEDLDGFHIGGYYRYTSREVNHAHDLSQDNIAFMLGYDILDWLSIYGVVGTSDAEIKDYDTDRDYDFLYGAGAWINILDHDLLSNLSCETKLRLSASSQITFSSPKVADQDCDYSDFYGALTLGIVNELIGNKNYWPDAIGVFFGPCWSRFDCDEFDQTGDKVGFAAGLDVYVTRRVGLSASYETYGSGDCAVNFSLNTRF